MTYACTCLVAFELSDVPPALLTGRRLTGWFCGSVRTTWSWAFKTVEIKVDFRRHPNSWQTVTENVTLILRLCCMEGSRRIRTSDLYVFSSFNLGCQRSWQHWMTPLVEQTRRAGCHQHRNCCLCKNHWRKFNLPWCSNCLTSLWMQSTWST